MSTDASYQLVTAKFSFIEQLNPSRSVPQSESKQSTHIKKIIHQSQKAASEPVTSSSLILYSNFITNNSCDPLVNNSWIAPYSFELTEELEFTAIAHSSRVPLGKIFFTLSLIYLMGVGGWLLYQTQGKFAWLFTRAGSVSQISSADLQFLHYMERSLEVIERKAESDRTDSTPNSQLDRSNLIYVPVYTPAPYPSQPALLQNLPNISPPVAQIEPPPPPSTLPPPPPPATPTYPQESSMAATSTSAVHDYVLVGVLELGEKSAALFKVQDTTKRIWLGEKIDNTGWILKSISNQQATISFQGKDRSLSIGEKF